MKKIVFYLMAVAAIMATACNEDEQDAFVPVTDITMDVSDLEVAPNVTIILKATVLPKDATNKKVTWSSSSASVKIDSSTGELTTETAGTATITVTTEEGAKTASRKITVKNVPVTGIELTDKELVLAPGAKRTLTAKILSAAATNKAVIWSSDNTAVATINSATGELDVRSTGEAIIRATSDENSSFWDECKLTAEFVNLLDNPGFEEQGSAFTEPLGWTKIPADWFTSYYDDPGNMAQYAAGNINRIGLFNNTGGNEPFFRSGNGAFFWLNGSGTMQGEFAARVEGNRPGGYYQLVTVSPGAEYGFTLYIGYKKNNNNNMSIKTNETVKVLSPDGLTTYHAEPVIVNPVPNADDANATSITKVTGQFVIPEGVTQVRFQFDQLTFGNPNQAPLMLVDECEFIQLTLPPE